METILHNLKEYNNIGIGLAKVADTQRQTLSELGELLVKLAKLNEDTLSKIDKQIRYEINKG